MFEQVMFEQVDMIRVKICGVTSAVDALFALEQGADALGFNFVPGTPRCLEAQTAREIALRLPPFGTRVGIFVNEDTEKVEAISRNAGLDGVQLHGDESPETCRRLREKGFRVIRGLRVRGPETLKEADHFEECTLLLDAYSEGMLGGSGKTFDWDLACEIAKKRPVILSGGLNPENVEEAIRWVRPYGVDVSSGVEGQVPGRKDPERVRCFIENARAAYCNQSK